MVRTPALSTVLWLGLALQSCGPGEPVFHGEDPPRRLSEWNLFQLNERELTLNPSSLRVKPANTLFTDYAHKLRTLWVPAGATINVVDNELDYPIGTILSKTFYYPENATGEFLQMEDTGTVESIPLANHRLLETRLLIRKQDGWDALPYVWNPEQTEAFLRVAGASLPAVLHTNMGEERFGYFVPNENQCSGCHQTVHPDGSMHPLGAIARQLNHVMPVGDLGEVTLLQAMQANGWLQALPTQPPMPAWNDTAIPIEQRARAYLDMNCGHCHNPTGPADTSALLLDGLSHDGVAMGFCKPPVAAGGGSGGRLFGIVPGRPDDSILLYRMESSNPGTMMPELGRSLLHREGIELVRQWIESLPGNCS